MEIRIATERDIDLIASYDIHVDRKELKNILTLGRVYIAEKNGNFIGWLRYNLFWDNTPFMNMLYFLKEERGRRYGTKLVKHWENEMKKVGYKNVMTSTASDEYAQHFYIKLNYKTVGGFIPEGEPFEIILWKCL